MKVDKVSVSFESDLGDAIRAAAKRSGSSISGWLAEAAAARLRSEAFSEFLAQWEAENGAITPEEWAKASRDLGLPVETPEQPAA